MPIRKTMNLIVYGNKISFTSIWSLRYILTNFLNYLVRGKIIHVLRINVNFSCLNFVNQWLYDFMLFILFHDIQAKYEHVHLTWQVWKYRCTIWNVIKYKWYLLLKMYLKYLIFCRDILYLLTSDVFSSFQYMYLFLYVSKYTYNVKFIKHHIKILMSHLIF